MQLLCPTRPASFRKTSLACLLAAVFALAAACGGGSDEPEASLQQVFDVDGVLTIGQFSAAGFKQSKQYDVTGLPGADAAYYGFWRSPGEETIDFELRFYPSHEAAVSDGTELVREVTGPEAAVTEADSTWKEGVKDRRTSGFTIGGGGGSLAVKYADYMIYGNVIMLCQGRDSEQSLQRCDQLIKAATGR